MAASIHTTSANAVTLVWGSLRLAPIIPRSYLHKCLSKFGIISPIEQVLCHFTYSIKNAYNA